MRRKYRQCKKMRIIRGTRFAALQVTIICCLDIAAAKVLDWYNPYMDFGGQIGFMKNGLCLAVLVFLCLSFFMFSGCRKR